jgi:hypothetical protein
MVNIYETLAEPLFNHLLNGGPRNRQLLVAVEGFLDKMHHARCALHQQRLSGRRNTNGTIAMQRLSLREAAQRSGANKSTILRAIQSGRLKAERTPENEWSIEGLELDRVYPGKSLRVAPSAPKELFSSSDASVAELAALQHRCDALEMRLTFLNEMLEETQTQRDQWQERAEGLMALVNAVPEPVERRRRPESDGLVVLFIGIVAVLIAVMLTAAAFVDNNENNEAAAALTLAVIGLGCCFYYGISKKSGDDQGMAGL